MATEAFTYTTYIATTPERLWEALTTPATTQAFWAGRWVESNWQCGSLVTYWADAARQTLDITGELLRVEPPRLLSFTFQAYPGGEVLREPPSRVSLALTPLGNGVVTLQVTHDNFVAESAVFPGMQRAWPAIMSSLKTLLETGTALPYGGDWPYGEPG
jgi:uncharacterized protein YndB with AHSA1/START domain